MNLGQTLITTGMLVLLIMSVVSANRMLMEVNQATYEAEALTASASVANDLLDEILSKRFDQFSDTTGTQSKYDFSPPVTGAAEWGPSPSERAGVGTLDSSYVGVYKSRIFFDDVDDYIGYARMVTMNNIRGLIVRVQVYYVNSFDPDTPLTEQNTYKKIAVTVEHPIYLTTPVTYSAMISY